MRVENTSDKRGRFVIRISSFLRHSSYNSGFSIM